MSEGREPIRARAVLGGGCFWCLEAGFRRIAGVSAVEPGYMGGHVPDPSYQDVCTGETGHAEVVAVDFDPERLPYAELLGWFFRMHDPTQWHRQGPDVGSQYRSVIFYADEEQRRVARRVIADLEERAVFPRPIVTELAPAGRFYPAEEMHRAFYERERANPYCLAVIRPKLAALGLE